MLYVADIIEKSNQFVLSNRDLFINLYIYVIPQFERDVNVTPSRFGCQSFYGA